MNISKKLIPLLLILPSPLALADIDFGFFDDYELKELHPVIGIMGGAATVMGLDASQNYNVGFTNYDYDPGEEYEVRGVFGGLIGVEWDLDDDWFVQTGLSYYQTSAFSPSGTLTQNAGMDFPGVYQYEYKIRSSQFLWESKFLTEWGEKAYPYLSIGLGLAFNEAEDYRTNVNPDLTFTPGYKSNEETSLSYSVGFGVDYNFYDNFRLGVGYRFTDLGKASLGDATLNNTTVSHSLEQDHMYTQEIIAQLTYIME